MRTEQHDEPARLTLLSEQFPTAGVTMAVATAAAGMLHLTAAPAGAAVLWVVAGLLLLAVAGRLLASPPAAVKVLAAVNAVWASSYLVLAVAVPVVANGSARAGPAGVGATALELAIIGFALTLARRPWPGSCPGGDVAARLSSPPAIPASPAPRRQFLRAGLLGVAGALSAGAFARGAFADANGGGSPLVGSTGQNGPTPDHGAHGDRMRAAHGAGLQVPGEVDHERNGFDPHEILTDFDGGKVSTDAQGRTVREYEFNVVNKEIEVLPGVFFPAWTYNGRVPGPTIRATEGDRILIHFVNTSDMPHTIHFHGVHAAEMDGVPGAGEVYPGESFTYDFIAEPFGTHLYHCHSLPLKDHIHRGLYGAFIVDPPEGRPEANEMVMILNGFDTNFDGENEVYAVNTVGFAYANKPVRINQGELQRAHVINVTEFDPINSIHLHANFFHLFRTGTALEPDEFPDTISMGQAERHMIEFTYKFPGRFMFHAHQSEFVELGWMSFFEVV